MSKRVNINQVLPTGYKAMMAFSTYTAGTSVSSTHKELIKIRASQINGCAFCIDMHTRDARKAGEAEHRIYALNAWRETPYFDEKERAILALTEELTLVSKKHVTNEAYSKAAELFEETYLAEVVMIIVNINAWNRIAIFSELEPAAH